MLSYKTRTDRVMARVAITILTIGLFFALYSYGPPLYWRFYATVMHPYQGSEGAEQVHPADSLFDNIIQDAIQQQQQAGDNGSITGSNRQAVQADKPFNPEDHALTRELIHSLAQDGYIMVTWANEHYLDFAVSWVANLKRAGITGYLVGAMDDDMLKSLVDRGINTWRMNTGITKKDLGWGSANFHKMGRSKIQLIKDVLAVADVTVVISDIDTAWMRAPFAFFDRYKNADILTSTDQLGPTVKTEDLERYPEAGASFNIGIMLFRANSKPFVDEWVKVLEKPDYWDQAAFNDLARKGAGKSDETGLFKGWNGQLTVGVLPAAQFASGHVFFVQRKHEEYGLKPYVAHATFQYSGTPGKRHRFREAMLFEDPAEYYDHPKGFISLKMHIPRAIWHAAAQGVTGEMTVDKMQAHFALVNHQLLYIRAGLAVATLTGRALIMPPIWCTLDKYWAPLFDGSIPGSSFKKPFICPMDHVFDLEGGWHPQKDENVFGPHVEWREYSFLENPRAPKSLTASRIEVEVCAAGESGCAEGGSPAVPKGGKIRLARGQASNKLAVSLQETSKYKVLEMSNILDLWPAFSEKSGWFDDVQQHARFVERLRVLTSVVCCLQHNPSWVWYDLLWDVPHRDRHHRQYSAWSIKPGDQDSKSLRHLMLAGSAEQTFTNAVDHPALEDMERMIFGLQ